MRIGGWLALAVLSVAPRMGLAQGIAPAPATPGMAMTRPGVGMANGPSAVTLVAPAGESRHVVDARPRLRHIDGLGDKPPSPDGALPNQRTGSRRQHVVHDICIGC